MGIKPSSMKES